jgi:putative N6-adenine-specific DNA methylase
MRTSLEEVCFAGTTSGLEPVLAAEARALGRVTEVAGGVEVSGAAGLHQELCLRLRTAGRVLVRLAQLRSKRWPEAAEELAAVDLSSVAAPGAPVSLESTVRLPGAPPAPALRAWLGRSWRRPVHAAAGEDRDSGGTRLVLRNVEGSATLAADASGELLHRRGWRQEVGRAPMRETLAAGVLSLAGWRDDEPLWDPMCGSGTLLIEAALRARHIAPGLLRAFAFEGWPRTEPGGWAARRQRAASEARPAAPAPLQGSDLNAGALGTSRRNARRAGVADSIALQRADVGTLSPGAVAAGLLLANLPYGRRVGKRSELEATFATLGDALGTRFRGWRAALLTAHPERLARAFGRRAEAEFPLDNGGLRVALCLFPAVEPRPDEPPHFDGGARARGGWSEATVRTTSSRIQSSSPTK